MCGCQDVNGAPMPPGKTGPMAMPPAQPRPIAAGEPSPADTRPLTPGEAVPDPLSVVQALTRPPSRETLAAHLPAGRYYTRSIL